jgi:glucose 1-dehydrogenase
MSENFLLDKQVALVTGASSGIGRAVAIEMARAGAKVVVNYHSHPEGGDETVAAIAKNGGQAFAIKADVSKEDEVLAMFREVKARYGRLDILVSNAGIQKDAPFTEMTLDDWNTVMDINLKGSFLCSREAARMFNNQKADETVSKAVGKIIFISSVHVIIPWATHANYTASKGGEGMLMKTLAQELAPQKIRVNSIAPGAIKTDINKKVWSDPEQYKQLLTMIPYGRIGEPEDIARLAVWLSSDQADYITGTTIYADGGMTLYPSFMHGG